MPKCLLKHQKWMRVSFALHPFQDLVFSMFQIWTILIDVYWYPIIILICFPRYIRCRASFPSWICHLYFFFDEMSIQTFCPFFKWVVHFITEFWTQNFFVYLEYQINLLQMFSSICGLCFFLCFSWWCLFYPGFLFFEL